MRDEIPARWREMFKKVNLTTGREFSRFVGLSPETGRRVLLGMPVSRATIEKVAERLHEAEETIHFLRGEEVQGPPFKLPREADRLTDKQRRVVLTVVDALLDTSRPDAAWPNQDEPLHVDVDDANASPFDRPPAPNDFFGRRRSAPEQPDPTTEASQQTPGDGGYWLADKQLPDDLPEAAAEGHGGDEDSVRRAKRELDEAGEESQEPGEDD